MTKLCKKYLADIKSLFPVLGKQERQYLAKLSESVEEYCEEEHVTTMEEIYNGFGQPYEVVGTYLSSMDISQLVKKIRFTKWIKRGIFTILLIIIVSVSIYGIFGYRNWKVFQREEIFFEDTIITD